ncbi:MAG TPA: methyltransferase domain-containing protein [Clostridiales bacterium]|nr:methyltransferase domain-containing protein [Clostridiales bacterium]HPV02292.1 methyltransferase domain-containing protein [Clostridiales bacterium]
MSAVYADFAFYYDRLMGDVDYSGWADYVTDIFRRHGLEPELAADLGCGTGSFCLEMAKRGFDMIGIDVSAEMLSIAKQKAVDANVDVLFLNQDMTSFELYGTVDAITCLVDSINYVTYKNDLKRMFRLVNNYLNPGGLFVFDINSPYKFENILSSNVFCETSDDVSYIWQNAYDRRSRLCRFDLTFFVKEGKLYRRFDETHYERNYDTGELERMLLDTGMTVLGIYDAFRFRKPGPKAERIFFVCRKRQ